MRTLVLLIVVQFAHIDDVYGRCGTESDACSQCACERMGGGGLQVDCSGRGLSTVPGVLPNNTVVLLLSGNVIKSTRADDFYQCHMLELLDLSDNQVERLSSGCFSSMGNIEEIYLNDNNLEYNKLPNDIFSELRRLRVCHLHNNKWQNLTSYPENMVSAMENLKVLTLDGFSGVCFGDEFSRLTSLETLHIYGGLDVISNDTFASFRNSSLTELSLKTKLSLNRMQPGSFSHFRKLKTLDLGYNQGLGFRNVPMAWWGLQYTQITKLVLTRIVPPDDQAARLTSDFFSFPKNNSIETLLVDRNNIVELESMFSVAFPRLKYLDISYNRITNIGSVLVDLVQFRNLTYLDFSRQAKRFVDENGRLPLKRSLNPDSTPVIDAFRTAAKDDWFSKCQTPPLTICLPSSFEYSPETWFKLDSEDPIKGTPLPDHGTWCIPLPEHLETLILTESLNVDIRTMPAMIVLNTTSLKQFEYRNNGIENLVMPWVLQNPMNVSVDFSENRIKCLSPDIFTISFAMGSIIEELLLAGNNLGEQLERDVEGISFRKYKNTKRLDLSRNSIKLLSTNAFSNTVSLDKLDLSQNSLRTFDFQFNHLTRLTLLNLSYNLLTTFEPSMTDQLSAVFQSLNPNGNLLIDLTGNPFQCSCETLLFLRWINANKNRMVNFPNYLCWFNESYVLFSNLENSILVELQFECSRRLAVIVSATLCAISLVLIVLSVCIYRYRWEVRYWCLWLTQRSRLYRELRDDNDYDFDAFVSYSSYDGDWVRNQLMPNLEPRDPGGLDGQANGAIVLRAVNNEVVSFRLCVHERDFLPGNDITGNIWEKMDRSRKVILVISPRFARSNFCEFEMNLARSASFARARNLFIPIILEPTKVEDMSDGLRWIVRNLTYNEWPREEHLEAERVEFWSKLRDAVADHGLSLVFQRH